MTLAELIEAADSYEKGFSDKVLSNHYVNALKVIPFFFLKLLLEWYSEKEAKQNVWKLASNIRGSYQHWTDLFQEERSS